MLQIYLFLCLIIFVLIFLSINKKITNIDSKNTKKKKKICVLKNCNNNNNTNNTNLIFKTNSIGANIQNKLNNTSCNAPRLPINNVYNKFYFN